MATSHQTELTASETSNLWLPYQNASMAKCALRHFIAHCDDENINHGWIEQPPTASNRKALAKE